MAENPESSNPRSSSPSNLRLTFAIAVGSSVLLAVAYVLMVGAPAR